MTTNTQQHTSAAYGRNTLGFFVYLMSDCILFAALFASYIVLRHETYGAITPAMLVDVPFVFIETLLLLFSSVTMGLALVAARTRRATLTLALLGVTGILGLSFLGMELSEFGKLIAEGNGPNRSASLSAFFTLVGTHGLHVALGLVWMLISIIYITRRGVTAHAVAKLDLLALFWHFLDIIWVCVFTFVYLFGALGI